MRNCFDKSLFVYLLIELLVSRHSRPHNKHFLGPMWIACKYFLCLCVCVNFYGLLLFGKRYQLLIGCWVRVLVNSVNPFLVSTVDVSQCLWSCSPVENVWSVAGQISNGNIYFIGLWTECWTITFSFHTSVWVHDSATIFLVFFPNKAYQLYWNCSKIQRNFLIWLIKFSLCFSILLMKLSLKYNWYRY